MGFSYHPKGSAEGLWQKPGFLCFFVKINQKIFKSGKDYISSIPQDYQTTNKFFLLESCNLLLNSPPFEPKRELEQLERKPIKSNSLTDLTNNPSLSLSHIFPTHPAVITSVSNLPASLVCVSFTFLTKISFYFSFLFFTSYEIHNKNIPTLYKFSSNLSLETSIIKPSKSPLFSHFTKLRMSARLNPPNKHPKIGQLIAMPTAPVMPQVSSPSISAIPTNTPPDFRNLSSDFAVPQPINRSSPDPKSVPLLPPIILCSDSVASQQIDRSSPDIKSVLCIPPNLFSDSVVSQQQVNRPSPDPQSVPILPPITLFSNSVTSQPIDRPSSDSKSVLCIPPTISPQNIIASQQTYWSATDTTNTLYAQPTIQISPISKLLKACLSRSRAHSQTNLLPPLSKLPRPCLHRAQVSINKVRIIPPISCTPISPYNSRCTPLSLGYSTHSALLPPITNPDSWAMPTSGIYALSSPLLSAQHGLPKPPSDHKEVPIAQLSNDTQPPPTSHASNSTDPDLITFAALPQSTEPTGMSPPIHSATTTYTPNSTNHPTSNTSPPPYGRPITPLTTPLTSPTYTHLCIPHSTLVPPHLEFL